jgi:hypothetical protein
MKGIFFFSTIIILSTLNQKTLAVLNPHPLETEDNIFYSSLSPHGEWIEIESGFQVWRPLHMHHLWRPYLLGQWIWTDDYGWYWISNEPFGWITYHYGRWHNDDTYGWVWMPDDVWGPAWVEWRYDDDYIGWAPLPPYATFNFSMEIKFTRHWIAPVYYWTFVHHHHFGSVTHYEDVASMEHTRRLIRTSHSEQQYGIHHDHIINRGVDRAFIERHGNIRISKTEVREVHEQSGERIIRSEGTNRIQRIELYRPSRDDIQQSMKLIEAGGDDRALPIDMKEIERTRIDSRKPSEEYIRRNPIQIEEQQPLHSIQREKQPHEFTPRVREQRPQQNRKELRQDLIERFGRKQNVSPPLLNRAQQGRMEHPRQSSPSSRPNRSALEKRSSRSTEKRGNK